MFVILLILGHGLSLFCAIKNMYKDSCYVEGTPPRVENVFSELGFSLNITNIVKRHG